MSSVRLMALAAALWAALLVGLPGVAWAESAEEVPVRVVSVPGAHAADEVRLVSPSGVPIPVLGVVPDADGVSLLTPNLMPGVYVVEFAGNRSTLEVPGFSPWRYPEVSSSRSVMPFVVGAVVLSAGVVVTLVVFRRRVSTGVMLASLMAVGALLVPAGLFVVAQSEEFAPPPQEATLAAMRACPPPLKLTSDLDGGRECYRRALDASLRAFGPAGTVEVVTSAFPGGVSPCHEVLHDLGRSAFLKLGEGSRIGLEQGVSCGMGYVHGALEAMALVLPSSQFVELSDEWCSAYAEGVPQVLNECQHGRGHALMRSTGGDLTMALTGCVSAAGDSVPCRFGVVMEWGNMFEVAPPGSDAAPLPRVAPQELCRDIEEQLKSACYTMTVNVERGQSKALAPYLLQCLDEPDPYVQGECVHAVSVGLVNVDREVTARASACEELPDETLLTRCREAVGYASTEWLRRGSSPEEVCAVLSGPAQASCVTGARRWLWEDANGVLS